MDLFTSGWRAVVLGGVMPRGKAGCARRRQWLRRALRLVPCDALTPYMPGRCDAPAGRDFDIPVRRRPLRSRVIPHRRMTCANPSRLRRSGRSRYKLQVRRLQEWAEWSVSLVVSCFSVGWYYAASCRASFAASRTCARCVNTAMTLLRLFFLASSSGVLPHRSFGDVATPWSSR